MNLITVLNLTYSWNPIVAEAPPRTGCPLSWLFFQLALEVPVQQLLVVASPHPLLWVHPVSSSFSSASDDWTRLLPSVTVISSAITQHLVHRKQLLILFCRHVTIKSVKTLYQSPILNAVTKSSLIWQQTCLEIYHWSTRLLDANTVAQQPQTNYRHQLPEF